MKPEEGDLGNETSAKDTAALGGQATENLPTERSRGDTVAARIHELKTWPEYFDAVLSGAKTFEFRKNDRGFQAGDILRLREYSPGPDEYTGREMLKRVSYILTTADFSPVTLGLRPGYCVMALVDGCQSGAASPEIGSVPNTAAETDGTVDDRKPK
jgi:hypothetical protein